MKRTTSICTRLGLYLMAMSVYTGFIVPDIANADIRTQAIVTVYSQGKIMATYEAIDRGRMDNDCYVFHIKKGVRDLEVRVCGTFTVEQIR